MPLHGTPRHPYLDHRLPIAFAHRGASGDHPENTMPAFQAAVDLGYRYLETDVQATADGVLVAFHDDDLQRTCGVEGKISELPWSEVQAARVDGEEPIPLFDELIEAFPEARFNIDCKSDAAAGPLTTALRRHRALERVCGDLLARAPDPPPARTRPGPVHVDEPVGGPAVATRARAPLGPGRTGPAGQGPIPIVTRWTVRSRIGPGSRCTCGR
ncbi:MAG: glycerophosphodiester phosphodiesterase family protein [Ilumatobacteraceae bacterium]